MEMDSLPDSFRIIKIQAENIKRIRAISITPTGNLVRITGRNGQGKTSILDAIEMLFAGKNAIPAKPIRIGANNAHIIADIGNIIVKRTWTADDKSYLTVEAKDGTKFHSPQSLLDGLLGHLSFDPLAFSRMEPDKQFNILRKLVTLDIDLEAVNLKRHNLYTDRTDTNREIKVFEAQLATIPEVQAPDQEISIAQLSVQQKSLMDTIHQNDNTRNLKRRAALDRIADATRKLSESTNTKKRLTTDLDSKYAQIQELEKKLAQTTAEIDTIFATITTTDSAILKNKQDLAQANAESKTADTEIAGIIDPDLTAITKEIEQAEHTNTLVRSRKDRLVIQTKLETAMNESADYTAQIDAIDAMKLKAISNAKFPIRGLGFNLNNETVTFADLPLAQASSAEQLKISIAIAMALNPKLRLIRITDGSLLDTQNLSMIADMAKANNYQVWIESVDESGKLGIYIEDGHIAAIDGTPVQDEPDQLKMPLKG